MSNRTVLVAGGTGGLGRAVSLAFLAQGANVVVTYREEQELAELKSLAGANAVRLTARATDVTDEAAVQLLVESIIADHSRLDVLVNTVGGYAGGINLWELDTKTFDRMFNSNVRSGFVLAKVAVQQMLKQNSGAIINIAAKAAFDHAAGASAYAASKAAAVALMDSLAADLHGTGVRVNSILPSIIDTPVNRKAMPKAKFDAWPKPEEIAGVILFLASDEARLIHGAAIPVYGNS
jgi:NAD(P)-dependent dehydrogenase (short-subunit alcohol dehydrogenase family)